MPSDSGGNGDGGGEHTIPLDVVVLKFNRLTDHLEISGAFNSVDLALDMLARGTRALEAQQRRANAIETAAAIADQQRARELAAKVRGGG